MTDSKPRVGAAVRLGGTPAGSVRPCGGTDVLRRSPGGYLRKGSEARERAVEDLTRSLKQANPMDSSMQGDEVRVPTSRTRHDSFFLDSLWTPACAGETRTRPSSRAVQSRAAGGPRGTSLPSAALFPVRVGRSCAGGTSWAAPGGRRPLAEPAGSPGSRHAPVRSACRCSGSPRSGRRVPAALEHQAAGRPEECPKPKERTAHGVCLLLSGRNRRGVLKGMDRRPFRCGRRAWTTGLADRFSGRGRSFR